jgi:uncharacterized protein (DUF1800 family)
MLMFNTPRNTPYARRLWLKASTALPLAFASPMSWGSTISHQAQAAKKLVYTLDAPQQGLLHQGLAVWLEAHLRHTPPNPVLQQRLDAMSTLGMSTSDLLQAFAQRLAGDTSGMVREIQDQAVQARLFRALQHSNQLEELLTDFWFNHFNVFIGKGLTRVLAARYEQEAIRPHIFGRFIDMLNATAKHPAMLFYLDQWSSSARTGLNENYARELMELHTLGVDAGYTQADVQALAKILSGWTFERRGTGSDLFRFDGRRHDGAAKRWLGKDVPGSGFDQGLWALQQLAGHSATAHHIAGRMARYFVSDNPSTGLIEQMAQRFLASDGDLKELVKAMVLHPDFVANPYQPRLTTPLRFAVSAARIAGVANPVSALPLANALAGLGMPLYGCPTPDGYSPLGRAWQSAEGLHRRVQLASQLGQARPAGLFTDAAESRTSTAQSTQAKILDNLLPQLSPASQQVITQAPPEQRAALALLSPEFIKI